jgi:2-C-methyl-D-erythritol 4-phosphate cytidylyltransferase
VVSTAALVPAAGRGDRLGAGIPKALQPVCGVPLLVHALRALLAAPSVALVAVAAPPGDVQRVRDLVAAHLGDPKPVLVVAGGPSRQASVAAALGVLPADVDVVVVHDAARAFAPADLVETVVAAVRAGADAVVPGLPVTDTIRRVGLDGRGLGTVDRADLRSVQTPQAFSRSVLEAGHAAAVDEETDDAALVERIGGRVVVVVGSDEAFKVTRPIDLVLAEALVRQRQETG